VDGVILSANAMKQELFYVGASRRRSEIAIVTCDREQLRESLGISTARLSLWNWRENRRAPMSWSTVFNMFQSKTSNLLTGTMKSASVTILAEFVEE
jgi:hypothetical protein